jgi:putative intracellular protease/amidase
LHQGKDKDKGTLSVKAGGLVVSVRVDAAKPAAAKKKAPAKGKGKGKAKESKKAKGTRRALFIFTEHSAFKHAGKSKATGWWLSEAAHPYAALKKKGWTVEFATPTGDAAPVDPESLKIPEDDAESAAFLAEHVHDGSLSSVVSVETLKPTDYDVVFFPGGHGPMFDLAHDESTAKFVSTFFESRKGVLGALCHGPAALVPVTTSKGTPLVKGHTVACFTNAEEAKVGLAASMPFALESKLRELGAKTVGVDDWAANVVVSGRLLTGQNPASAKVTVGVRRFVCF